MKRLLLLLGISISLLLPGDVSANYPDEGGAAGCHTPWGYVGHGQTYWYASNQGAYCYNGNWRVVYGYG